MLRFITLWAIELNIQAADCAAASVRIFTYTQELNGFHHLVPKIFFAKSEKIFVVQKCNLPFLSECRLARFLPFDKIVASRKHNLVWTAVHSSFTAILNNLPIGFRLPNKLTRKKFPAGCFLSCVKRVVLKKPACSINMQQGLKVCFLGARYKKYARQNEWNPVWRQLQRISIRGCPHVGSVVPIAIHATTRKNTQTHVLRENNPPYPANKRSGATKTWVFVLNEWKFEVRIFFLVKAF